MNNGDNEDDDNDDDDVDDDDGRGVRPSEELRLFSDTVNHVLSNARDNVYFNCPRPQLYRNVEKRNNNNNINIIKERSCIGRYRLAIYSLCGFIIVLKDPKGSTRFM